MKHRIEFFRRFFRYMYEALLATIILLFFMIIFVKHEPDILTVVWVFVLFGASYMIREWAPNYLLIIIMHFGVAGVSILLPVSISAKVIYLGYLLFFLLPESIIYAKRFSHLAPLNDLPWPSVLAVLLTYLYGHGVHSSLLINCSYIFMIIMLFCYLLLIYVEGLSRYIEQTNDVSGLPLSKIVQTNSKIVVVLLTVLLAALLLGRNIDVSWIVDYIKDIFVEAFRLVAFVFVFLYRILAGMISTTELSDETVYHTDNYVSTGYRYSIGAAFEILLNICLVVLVVVLLYKIGRRALKFLLSDRSYDQDLIEQAERKKNIQKEKISIKKRILLHWTYDERIRRCYKYTIENFQPDINLSEHQTCHDIEADIDRMELGNVKELTEIYTEIRYGNCKADRELLKRVDELSKHAVIKGS